MPYEPPPWPLVVAHRGDSSQAPENTRLAIESAIDIGVDMVEVDVRLTKDTVPILIHYARLEHTTTGRGLLADHTWEEIQGLDAGAWMGPEFAGERIPSLHEVLDLSGRSDEEKKATIARFLPPWFFEINTILKRVEAELGLDKKEQP